MIGPVVVAAFVSLAAIVAAATTAGDKPTTPKRRRKTKPATRGRAPGSGARADRRRKEARAARRAEARAEARAARRKEARAARRKEARRRPPAPPAPPPAPDEPGPTTDKAATKKDAAKLVPHKVTRIEDQPKTAPRDAAIKLYKFAASRLRAGMYAALGVKGKPSETVERLQTAMRRLTADGIYGPKTRARGKELLGKDFPIRKRRSAVIPLEKEPPPAPPPAPPPPVTPSPPEQLDDEPQLLVSTTPSASLLDTAAAFEATEQPEGSARDAATELLSYVRGIGTRGRAKALGYKNRPNETIRIAQEGMGGLVTDGIYGNKTRSRGYTLINKKFPPR